MLPFGPDAPLTSRDGADALPATFLPIVVPSVLPGNTPLAPLVVACLGLLSEA